MRAIGFTVGIKSRPNTPDMFHFWLPGVGESLAIGSIVKVVSGKRCVYGIIEGMESYTETEDFLYHQLSRSGDPELRPPSEEQSVVVAKGRVLKQDIDRPMRNGLVFYPQPEELLELLNPEGCDIPVGVFANTNGTMVPVKVDEKYLLGPEGAHLNISGMSGLGTKTSTFLFLLSSIFTHSNARVACIMFNIKSDDLLHIRAKSEHLAQSDFAIYSSCRIKPRGFKARCFATMNILNEANSLRKDADTFRWGYQEVKEFIPSLLKAGDQDQKEKLDTAFYELKKMAGERGLKSFSELLEFMRRELIPEDRSPTELVRGSYKATWIKLYNQLRGLETKYDGLTTAYEDEVVELPYKELGNREIWVIDLQQLGFYPRKLVFEKVISEFEALLESNKIKVDRIILFMDELNKYAPSHNSPEVASLKSKLIDISARGRSIGFSLFGAEQFKSRVDQNIMGNVSTDIYGKTKEAELLEPIYKKFSNEIKGKIMRFKKEDKLLDHELFEAPIFVKLPRPPCKLGSDIIREKVVEETTLLRGL
ncbi:MAG: hypothetical protein QF673_02310 [Candidatus Hydrothermarchaeota archaeon]|nr:hypothetical protein [Candidatus Hydrothermarchaeota archaeon]